MDESLLDEEPRQPRLSFFRSLSIQSKPASTPSRSGAGLWCCSPVAFLAFCFCCCGVGVALPWTALRMGVAYLRLSFNSSALYPRLFSLYYLMQALVLLAQCKVDRAFDLRYGAAYTYTFRLSASICILAVALAVFPLAATSEGALYALTAIIGIFDACAFGSCAQLFSSIKTTNASGFYFLGCSLSSLLSSALSYATGFTALSSAAAPSGGGARPTPSTLPAPLLAFYALCSCTTLCALAAVLVLLFSEQGRGYLVSIDDALLQSEPLSPRAIARKPSQRFSPLERWGLVSEAAEGGLRRVPSDPLVPAAGAAKPRVASLGSLQGGEQFPQRAPTPPPHLSAAAPAAASQTAPPSPQADTTTALASNTAIFWATLNPQLAIFFLWASTTAVDSLISYFPSETQALSGSWDSFFTVQMLYASLCGELSGKLLFLLGGARRVYDGAGGTGGGGDGGGVEGGAQASREGTVGGEVTFEEGLEWASLALGDFGGTEQPASAGASGNGSSSSSSAVKPRRAFTLVPCISSTHLLLVLSLLRTLACAPFFFLLMQQLFGPARGELLRGWFYSNFFLLSAQFLFDLLGSFLSSMTYTLIPFVLPQSERTQASSILSFTLTLGTFLGLGVSILSSSFLPSV